MAYDLYIKITGLCILVDDPHHPAGPRLHALLPRTSHGGHGAHVEAHLARLLYDEAHEDPARQPTGRPRQLHLQNRKVRIPDSGTGPQIPTHADHAAFHLGNLVEAAVDRSLVDDLPPESFPPDALLSRVTLTAGTISGHNPGARWRLARSSPMHMAIAVEWMITVADEQSQLLTLELEPLNPNGSPHSVTLHPKRNETTQRDEIRLWVYHTLRREIPATVPPPARTLQPPRPGEEKATHFAAFYDLLSVPVPVYEDLGGVATLNPGGDEGRRDEKDEAAAAREAGAEAAPVAAASAAASGEEAACIAVVAIAAPPAQG